MSLIFPCWALFAVLSTGLVIMERFLLHYVQRNVMRTLYDELTTKEMTPAIVYGAGLNCRLFLDGIGYRSNNPQHIQVLGVVDDDPALKGLRLYGTKVLGQGSDLEAIYQKYPFRKVLLTAELGAPAMQALLDFCRAQHISVDQAGLTMKRVLADGDDRAAKA